MTKISKQANVAYSARQMFALVNDIKSYPEFLPWCTEANILEEKSNYLIASISISLGKIKQSFTTENTMKVDTSISMKLVKGPFKKLNGYWQFHDRADGGCSVSLDMQFEFKNKIMKHTLGAAFKKITSSLVDAFVDRARVVYGTE
jgi:ribosome-associated toxin RatA of RatAB toxin-antitoxin module